MTTYFAEWYVGEHRFRSPEFESIEDVKEYLENTNNTDAPIYAEER